MAARRSRRHARQWRELSCTQKVLTAVLGAAELVLTVLAARDLATRDAAEVRGRKALWAPLLAVQPLGPIAYLAFGRRAEPGGAGRV